MHSFRYPRFSLLRVLAVIGGVGCMLASGCASQPAEPPTTAELCASLQDVIAQSETRFRKFKTTPTISPFSGMTKWETRPVFPDSHCDVLEWAGGRTNYVCTWPDGTEAQARDTYEQTVGKMAECLTVPWAKSETRGQTGGATTFTRLGKQTQVVLRYFRPRGGYGPAWETSLTIGDEITAEPR